jgi:hypothetical protein
LNPAAPCISMTFHPRKITHNGCAICERVTAANTSHCLKTLVLSYISAGWFCYLTFCKKSRPDVAIMHICRGA